MASESQKEAFVELQGRLVETNAKLKQVSQQLLGKEREKRRAVITGQELEELPADTRTFRAIEPRRPDRGIGHGGGRR
ncbi:hypothetical protein CBR_g16047 [Chara braunii]|uniref:Uncharacterized protein n=1 Tax=Chara braunii TaxID=69332 RepID=A0A388JT11_CHABU|nr:hypothetical protein CBR_g16047 [Chara braunii]|eukprot:GBG60925.1 hypothetical protein CBR_g16047 [Chara braunii]